MPAQTMKDFLCELVADLSRHKIFAMATSLDRRSIFSQELFIDGIKATIRVEMRAPVVEWEENS